MHFASSDQYNRRTHHISTVTLSYMYGKRSILKALHKNSMESTLNSTLKSFHHFLHYQSPNIIKSPNTGKTIKSTSRIGQDEDDGHVSIWAKLYTKRNQMKFLQLSIQNIHRLCCCGGLTQVSTPLVLFTIPQTTNISRAESLALSFSFTFIIIYFKLNGRDRRIKKFFSTLFYFSYFFLYILYMHLLVS